MPTLFMHFVWLHVFMATFSSFFASCHDRINEPFVDAHVIFMDKLFYFLSEVGKLGVRVT